MSVVLVVEYSGIQVCLKPCNDTAGMRPEWDHGSPLLLLLFLFVMLPDRTLQA